MSILKKLFVFVVLIAVIVVGATYALRLEALCQPVTKKKAVMAVPGSVTVVAEYSPQLLAEVGGKLISSELDPGRTVKKGEVLAQIDPADLNLEIERIEIDTAAAKKRIEVGSQIELELKSAEEELAELETRAASNNYPMAELIKKRRGVEVIKQRRALELIANDQLIATYENTLAQKKRQLAKMTIVAPFDGVVAEDLTTPGQLIGDRTPIASLIANKRTIEAKISEESFASVKVGQPVTVRFLGTGEYLWRGSVSKILPTADPTTQRNIVHLTVDIDPEKLKPGNTGEVSILT
ncbi:MAG: HlyD family efflux transporter periplasmic adaptor subunit, partial [Opitutaceae bacterium]